MSGIAAGIAGTAIVGSTLASIGASQNAANAQERASQDAITAQQGMFNIQNENQRPYREAGYGALKEIQDNMSTYNKPFTMADFQADPGYQFTMDEGRKAIEASSATHSGLLSGNELANASKYAQNLSSTEFGNAYNRYQSNISNNFNRLSSVAGLGQTAVQGTNAAAQATGNAVGQNLVGIGNAQASGQVGSANAINNGIGQGINGYMNYSILSKLGQPNSPPPPVPTPGTPGTPSYGNYNPAGYGNLGVDSTKLGGAF